MIRHFALVAALCTILPCAARAQSMNFSTLAWGDSSSVAHDKLVASGYSGFALQRRLYCKAVSDCSLSFSGAGIINGTAFFTSDKLTLVTMAVPDPAAALTALTGKYGAPRVTLIRAKPSKNATAQREDRTVYFWQSAAGAIELEQVLLTYYSPDSAPGGNPRPGVSNY